jgi:hypothetical protein
VRSYLSQAAPAEAPAAAEAAKPAPPAIFGPHPLCTEETYTNDERVTSQLSAPHKPGYSKKYHLFVSRHNKGAGELVQELEQMLTRGTTELLMEAAKASRLDTRKTAPAIKTVAALKTSSSLKTADEPALSGRDSLRSPRLPVLPSARKSAKEVGNAGAPAAAIAVAPAAEAAAPINEPEGFFARLFGGGRQSQPPAADVPSDALPAREKTAKREKTTAAVPAQPIVSAPAAAPAAAGAPEAAPETEVLRKTRFTGTTRFTGGAAVSAKLSAKMLVAGARGASSQFAPLVSRIRARLPAKSNGTSRPSNGGRATSQLCRC